MDQERIGKFIASSRKKQKLTQQELAERLGVTNKSISRWENGKTLPDISFFKPLCEILNISIEELINGEKTDFKRKNDSVEKAIINTMNTKEKEKRKMNKIISILLIFITIIIFILFLLIIYYKQKFPKINIFDLNIVKSDSIETKSNVILSTDKYKVWFYGIDSLQIMDENNNYFDLKSALLYNQLKLNDVKSYLELQYKNGNIERYILSDGGTKIYKSNKYEAIVCNTIDGNYDVYFGKKDMVELLNNNYCGKEESNICYFTRTYHITNIAETDDKDFVNVTLKSNKGEVATVRINNSNDLKAGLIYEFKFSTYKSFDDNIENIFNNSTLIDTKESNELSNESINENICVNK